MKEQAMHTVEVKETRGCTKTLSIEVERERFDEEMKSALQSIRREVQMPGFRKGHVPESMLLQRFGATVQQEALKEMIPRVLNEVIESEHLKPVGEPKVLDVDLQDDGPIRFTVSIEESPEIDIEPFKGIQVTKELHEVTDDMVDSEVERVRNMRATQEDVDRDVQAGDILVLNLQKLTETGVPLIGEKIENHVVALDGQSTPSPEFDEQMYGMKAGEKKQVSFTYDESIENPDLVGTTERYEVEVLRVLENRVPELTDEFAKEIGFENGDDFRVKTRERIRDMFDRGAAHKLHGDIVNEYLLHSPFEVPGTLVDRVIASETERASKQQQGEEFDEQAFRDRIRPDAVRLVQTWLIVDAVKEKQGIEVSSEEVNARIDEIAAANGVNPKELKRRLIKEGRFNGIRDDIAEEKAYQWMESVAEIEEVTAAPQPESNIVKP